MAAYLNDLSGLAIGVEPPTGFTEPEFETYNTWTGEDAAVQFGGTGKVVQVVRVSSTLPGRVNDGGSPALASGQSFEMLSSVRWKNGSSAESGLIVGGVYMLRFGGTTLAIAKFAGANLAGVQILSVKFDTTYRIRWQYDAVTKTFRGRYWLATDPEPTTWGITHTLAAADAHPTGTFGFATRGLADATTGAVRTWYGPFGVGTAGDAAPNPWAPAKVPCPALIHVARYRAQGATAWTALPLNKTAAPWEFAWDVKALPAGAYELQVGAYRDTETADKAVWSATRTFAVQCNVGPIAEFDLSALNLTAQLTDRSTDTDGTIVAWAWRVLDSLGAVVLTSGAQSPAFVMPAAGTYTFELTVTDNGGLKSAPRTRQQTFGAGSTVPPYVSRYAPTCSS